MNSTTLSKMIQENFPAPYVYSYPTTRRYRPVPNFSLDRAYFTEDINVYIHIPFCNQKCSFCGYLTVIERNKSERDVYVNALVQEIEAFAPYAINKIVRSVNFGGGTPSLLSSQQVERIFNALSKTFPNFLTTATEISMEATPESVEYEKLHHLQQLGFNRISVGIQTLDNTEIANVKRHNLSGTSFAAMEIVRKAGISNLCVDMMYGLPSQTLRTWESGIVEVMSYLPETIELYKTVVIPGTGIAKTQSVPWTESRGYLIWSQYDVASHMLSSSGYRQDSQVRFTIPRKGFYRQQSNVFRGQSLIGFGVGARSYADNVHFRNIYSTQHSKTALRRYISSIREGICIVESAVFLSREEKARRYAIYNLECLDCDRIERTYGIDLVPQLAGCSFFKRDGNTFSLFKESWYDRDVIAYSLFSKKSLEPEKSYYGFTL